VAYAYVLITLDRPNEALPDAVPSIARCPAAERERVPLGDGLHWLISMPRFTRATDAAFLYSQAPWDSVLPRAAPRVNLDAVQRLGVLSSRSSTSQRPGVGPPRTTRALAMQGSY